MAVIHDVMPVFELFQPASIDDAHARCSTSTARCVGDGRRPRHFDWLKDRNKRPKVVVDLSGVAGAEGREGTADGGLEIGAMTTLTEVVRHPLVREKFRC